MSHGNMQYLIIQNPTLEYSSYVSDMNFNSQHQSQRLKFLSIWHVKTRMHT